MARRNSTPKQGAGGGHYFENPVVAYFLVHLLARRAFPIDPPGGVVERVDTQRPASEWHLDDLRVTVRSNHTHQRLAFSIKSNRQITGGGFPREFIRYAWEQLLHDSSDLFDEGHDYLGLVTGTLGAETWDQVSELLRLARDQEPADLAIQVGLPHRANVTVRKLYESARCPDDLASKHSVDQSLSAGRLLKRLLVIPFDFESAVSRQQAEAVNLCQDLLRSGSAEEAGALWRQLEQVAGRLRRSAGGIDLPRLVDELRGQFDLREFPDYAACWERLNEDTNAAIRRVRTTIGGSVTLPRQTIHETVSHVLQTHRMGVLLGASGIGKSAIAVTRMQATMAKGRVLWFDADRLHARSLAEWRLHLGLPHSFNNIIRGTPVTDAILVLDGLDRLYDDEDFGTAAELVKAIRFADPGSPWRLLITSTPEEWTRVRTTLTSHLTSHGITLPAEALINVDVPSADELEAVWEAYPRLAALRSRNDLGPVLTRPKVLDLLASSMSDLDDITPLGEADLARLFWNHEVVRGPRSISRAAVARQIAVAFADDLCPDGSTSYVDKVVGTNNSLAVDELIKDRVLVLNDGRISFEHDLYGDWIRALYLKEVDEMGDVGNFVAWRLQSPVWHRALHLHAVSLFEQVDGVAAWTQVFKAMGLIPRPSGTLAQDILLEAVVLSSPGKECLLNQEIWSLLVAEDGLFLERLLKRLFHTASFPNVPVVEAVARAAPALATHAAAEARLPSAPSWSKILTLIYVHRDEIPARIRGLAARAADMWLRSTRPTGPFRSEAAAIAVALGEALLREKQERGDLFYDGEADQDVYRSVLAAGYEEPELVEQIILEAAGRRDQRFAAPPLTDAELVEINKIMRQRGIPGSFAVRDRAFANRWPHGPAFRVDGALQKTVFETEAIIPLAEALPDVARETLLALLISAPRNRSPLYDDDLRWYALERPRWHPQFYTRGPFRTFLSKSEESGVTAILQLVNHASERWIERQRTFLRRSNSPTENTTPTVRIDVDGEVREYIGDAQVFRWSHFGPDGGGVVGSALVALEKHLYDRADAGDDITPLIHRLLSESRSLSIIGILAVFGCRHPQYFRRVLRGLFGSPYILAWTFQGSVSDVWRSALLPGYSLVPEFLRDEYRHWHEMPHRTTPVVDVALYLFVNDSELRPYFNDIRERFMAESRAGGEYENWTFIENLIAQFDLANYELVEGHDNINYYQYKPPAELQRKHAETVEHTMRSLLLSGLPIRCRRLLDGEERVDVELLDDLWEQAQRVEALCLDADDDAGRQSDALAGVAAVMIVSGADGIHVEPSRAQWAREILINAALQDRRQELEGAFDWDRRIFSTDALAVIWAESPDDPTVRKAVAHLALHCDSDGVGRLASGVSRVRERLRDDHMRLVNAVLRRARLEAELRAAERPTTSMLDRGSVEGSSETDQKAVAIRDMLVSLERALIDGTLEPMIPGLDDIAPPDPLVSTRRRFRNSRRPIPGRLIDDGFAVAAYQGIPVPIADEIEPWIAVWERTVRQSLAPLSQCEQDTSVEPDSSPGPWDYYLMQRAAQVVASTEDHTAARNVWQPVIDLGNSAADWVMWFLREWSGYALHPSASEHVVTTWMNMIDAALGSSRWKSDSVDSYIDHRTGELWRGLLGFVGFGYHGADVWNIRLRSRVRRLHPQILTWADIHLTNPDTAQLFARFLTMPAAADLTLEGLVRLHDVANVAGDRFWGRSGHELSGYNAVLSLLMEVWNHRKTELRREASAFKAFQGFLEVLVSRHHAPSLEFADRVGASRR